MDVEKNNKVFTDEEMQKYANLVKEDYRNFDNLPEGLTIQELFEWCKAEKNRIKIGHEKQMYYSNRYSEANELLHLITIAEVPINALGTNGYMSLAEMKARLRGVPTGKRALLILVNYEKELREINQMISKYNGDIQIVRKEIIEQIHDIVNQLDSREEQIKELKKELEEMKKELRDEKGLDKTKIGWKIDSVSETIAVLRNGAIPDGFAKLLRKLDRKCSIIDFIEKNKEKDLSGVEVEI